MKQNWTYKKLGEVGTVIGGSTPKTDVAEFWNGDFAWITPAELDGSKYIHSTVRTITKEAIEKTNLTLLPVGTVLLSSRAPIGKVCITTIPMYCNQGFKNIVCSDKLNNEFLYWWLKGKNDYLNSLGVGATFKEISKRIVEQIIIPVPPIETQSRIVSELDLLQSIIDKQQAQLKELDKLAQSIFYDMFGDPVENEKGWEVKRFDAIGEIVSGSTPSTTDESNWDGNVNWITPAEMGVQLYYGETQRKITEKAAKRLTIMPVGTVLLSSRAPIGKLAIASVPMCCNQGFKNIICGKSVINVFLYYYLMLTMDNVLALGRGATFKEISKQAISAYTAIVPPLPLQQSFAAKIESIEKQKAAISQSIAETQELFDYTMDKYFGE